MYVYYHCLKTFFRLNLSKRLHLSLRKADCRSDEDSQGKKTRIKNDEVTVALSYRPKKGKQRNNFSLLLPCHTYNPQKR